MISPLVFLICAITTLSTIAISRYVSLGSIVGGLTSIICGLIFFFVGQFGFVHLPQLVYLIVGPALVIIFHYDNIVRLLTGKERKIGQKVQLDEGTSSTGSSPSQA